MLGYKYEQFKYDVSDTKQVGYGPWASYTVHVPEKTLKYKVTYHIPYFGLNSDAVFGKKFQGNVKLGYTPWATAKDKDNHLLSYKLSRGDTDGYAYFANLNMSYNFSSHLFLGLDFEYLKIRTTGKQHQSFYAGPYEGTTSDVDDKISSKQWFLTAMVTYRF